MSSGFHQHRLVLTQPSAGTENGCWQHETLDPSMQSERNMKLKLGMAEEKHVLNELNARKSIASLTQKKDEVLSLSIERGRVIQEKQGEIQQLERKWKEEKKCRAEAEDRTLPPKILLKPLIVSLRGTSLPKWPVKTSATWKGCDKKRWILRARATVNDTGLNHFMVQVISLTGSLSHSSKDRVTTMSFGYIVD
ncbi:hypothetical protein INR49_005366 [Caranx melampygus]|nr:hypothetical protein INR49_005366 [Caranx melampygus]